MPHTRSTEPSNRRPRVPLGLFLASRPDRHGGTGTGLPAWHGLRPADVAILVRAYTRREDLIVDLDAHPTITAAARYLGRFPATLDGTGHDQRVRPLPAPPEQPETDQPETDQPGSDQPTPGLDEGAALMLVTLPRPDLAADDRPALVDALCRWRALLRPGGHLIVVPTSTDAQGRISHRASVIAAAHEAGLRWQQHLLIIAGPPDHEPRTEPAPTVGARLLDGRHVPAHRTPLAFTTIAQPEAAHV